MYTITVVDEVIDENGNVYDPEGNITGNVYGSEDNIMLNGNLIDEEGNVHDENGNIVGKVDLKELMKSIVPEDINVDDILDSAFGDFQQNHLYNLDQPGSKMEDILDSAFGDYQEKLKGDTKPKIENNTFKKTNMNQPKEKNDRPTEKRDQPIGTQIKPTITKITTSNPTKGRGKKRPKKRKKKA